MAINVGDAVMEFLGDTSKLEQAYQRVQDSARQNLAPAQAEANKLGTALEGAGTQGAAATNKITAGNKEVAASSKSAYSAIKTEANQASDAIGGISIKLTTLIQGFAAMKAGQYLKEMVDGAMEFNRAFAEVMSIMDTKTPEGKAQLAQMKDEILALNPALGDATDLTRGLYEAISSGVEPTKAVRFVGEAALFAKAALTDTFSAVDVMTSVINAYGKSASEANHVSAALFETIILGKTRGPELAESLGRVIPIAASLKVNLSEVLAATATLTLAGLDTNESMTALRGTLSELLNPSREAEKEAAKLGMSLSKLREELQTKGLAAVMGEMASKTRGSTEATGALFGNVRALNGVLTLTGEQAGRYKEILGQVQDAEKKGTLTAEAANLMFEAQGNQMSILGNSMKRDFIKAWEDAAPVVNTFMQAIKMLVVDSGALKLVLGAVGFVAIAIAEIFQATVLVLNGFGGALSLIIATMIQAAGHIPLLKKYVNDSGSAFAFFNESAKQFQESATDSAEKIVGLHGSFLKLIGVTGDATKATEKDTSASEAAAKTAKDLAAAADAAAQAKMKQAEAAKDAEAAVKKYAAAHGIHLVGELKKAADAATAFYQTLVATSAPMSEQNSAWLTMNKAVGAYRLGVSETRNELQKLIDLIRVKPVGTEPSKMGNTIDLSADEQAIADLQEAMKALGITGSAVFAEEQYHAEEAYAIIRDSGVSTYVDILKAKEAMLSVKVDYSSQFPPSEELAALKAQLKSVRDEMEKLGITADKTSNRGSHFFALWMAGPPKLAAVMKNLGKMGKESLDSMGGAMANAVVAFELGQDSLGHALLKGTAQLLAQLSAQAAVYALFYTAMGFAKLAQYDGVGAALAFHAAGIYAGVAVVAGAGAMLLNPKDDSGSSSSGDSSSSSSGDRQTQQAEATPITKVNTLRFSAGALITQPTMAMLGDSRHQNPGRAIEGVLPLEDDHAMSMIAGAITTRMSGRGGGDTFNIDGVISSDVLDDVIRQISGRVQNNDVQLHATTSRRVVKK